jgi:hypothetical protein
MAPRDWGFFNGENMENTHDATIAEVKDLALCSYLYATKLVKLEGKKKLANGTVILLFSPKDKADKLINLYWNLQAPPIQPKEILSAERDIKHLIFSS